MTKANKLASTFTLLTIGSIVTDMYVNYYPGMITVTLALMATLWSVADYVVKGLSND